MALINVAKKAAEGGMGALDWSELAILQQYLTGQGFKNFKRGERPKYCWI